MAKKKTVVPVRQAASTTSLNSVAEVRKSLEVLIGELECEAQRVKSGEDSDPERYVRFVLHVVQQFQQWPDARGKLHAILEKVGRRFMEVGEFTKLRGTLFDKLNQLSVDDRPKQMTVAEATKVLDGWRHLMGGNELDILERDPAQAARELHDNFKGWRIPESASQALRAVELELTGAASDDPTVPFSGIKGLVSLMLTKPLTQAEAEELFRDVDAPTVEEMLEGARWLMDWVGVDTPAESDAPLPGEDAAPKGPAGESTAETAGQDGKANLEKRVESLERNVKKRTKPLTKREKIRNQRIKFCCPRRRKKSPDTWNEINSAYTEKYPGDKTASPDTLLHSHDRNCPQCREEKS